MQKIKMTLTCFVLSVLATLIILVVNSVQLLFNLYDSGIYTTYFCAIIVEIIEDYAHSGFRVRFNNEQLHPIWLTTLFIFVFYYLCGFLYFRYKNKELLKA